MVFRRVNSTHKKCSLIPLCGLLPPYVNFKLSFSLFILPSPTNLADTRHSFLLPQVPLPVSLNYSLTPPPPPPPPPGQSNSPPHPQHINKHHWKRTFLEGLTNIKEFFNHDIKVQSTTKVIKNDDKLCMKFSTPEV